MVNKGAFVLQQRVQRVGDPATAAYDPHLQLNVDTAGEPLVMTLEAADLVKTISKADASPED